MSLSVPSRASAVNLTNDDGCWRIVTGMSITVQLDLPEALAEKARAEGLLQPPRRAAMLEEEVERARQAREFIAMLDEIRAQPGEPMRVEEIQKVVDEVRSDRARRETGR